MKMELDNKLATSGSRDTVTSLYRRHEAKFSDHSSLNILKKMIRALISVLLASLSILPQVMSYAKVWRNGQEDVDTRDDDPWIVRLDHFGSFWKTTNNVWLNLSIIFVKLITMIMIG